MNGRRLIGALLSAAALVALAVPASAAGATVEYRDVVGQGPGGPVVSANGAALVRTDTGVNAMLRMPTPEPGSYVLPPVGNAFLPAPVSGYPEAYSLWAFVFNYPALCNGPCDMDDLGATPAQGGVYNVAGHVSGGGTLQLSGRISVGQSTFGGVPLMQPRTAAVHLAVAPHGQVDPALMPDQITKPIGGPPWWWLAIF